MITKQEKNWVIQNRVMILQIAGKYLDFYKTLIWKEKDTAKKAENSAVADRIDDLMITVKGMKFETDKKDEQFTGL